MVFVYHIGAESSAGVWDTNTREQFDWSAVEFVVGYSD
jgi:hypothetical protein